MHPGFVHSLHEEWKLAHFQQKIHVFSVQATLKGEEKTKPAARRQTHTQGRFLVILTVRHIFLPYAK